MKPLLTGLGLAVAGVLVLGGSTAFAAFPGTNGQIAFERLLLSGSGTFDIFAIGPAGGEPALLAGNNQDDNLQPSYSADGEKIAFVRSAEDTIWVMNADGSGQTQLTDATPLWDDGNPAFSPDGRLIVFERLDPSGSEIFVMDANGQNPVQLTDNTVTDRDPSFSPDGQKIVFSRETAPPGIQGIFVMDANGQNPVPLSDEPGFEDLQPDFSPDGTQDRVYAKRPQRGLRGLRHERRRPERDPADRLPR